jgi:hypothetical protein
MPFLLTDILAELDRIRTPPAPGAIAQAEHPHATGPLPNPQAAGRANLDGNFAASLL